MNINYIKNKDVYYNNTVYKIPEEDLKHIDGIDVVKLPNNLILYWDDIDQKWKLATQTLIEKYTGKKYINVEFNGEVIKCISNLDLYFETDKESLTEVNIKCVVIFDKQKNIWKILTKNDDMYNKYSYNENFS